MHQKTQDGVIVIGLITTLIQVILEILLETVAPKVYLVVFIVTQQKKLGVFLKMVPQNVHKLAQFNLVLMVRLVVQKTPPLQVGDQELILMKIELSDRNQKDLIYSFISIVSQIMELSFLLSLVFIMQILDQDIFISNLHLVHHLHAPLTFKR